MHRSQIRFELVPNPSLVTLCLWRTVEESLQRRKRLAPHFRQVKTVTQSRFSDDTAAVTIVKTESPNDYVRA
jgi:hypothetical protein